MSGYLGFREWSWSSSTGAVQHVASMAADQCDFVDPPPAWFFTQSGGIYVDSLNPLDIGSFMRSLASLDLDRLAEETSIALAEHARLLTSVARSYERWWDSDGSTPVAIVALPVVVGPQIAGFLERAVRSDAGLDELLSGLGEEILDRSTAVEISMADLRLLDRGVSEATGQPGRRLFEPGPRMYLPVNFAAATDGTNIWSDLRPWRPLVSDSVDNSLDRALAVEHNLNFPLVERISEVQRVAPLSIAPLDELLLRLQSDIIVVLPLYSAPDGM